MHTVKQPGSEFIVDSNVHIEVVSPQHVIRQTVDKHNKATKRLVTGLLRFALGEFTTTYERTKESEILYRNSAKDYIPCFIGMGTGGIRLTDAGIPDYNLENRRWPPTEAYWNSDDNKVKFTDTELEKEISVKKKSRVKIDVIGFEETTTEFSQTGDIEHIVLSTEIPPGYYSDIYDNADATDIFISEIGLFASGVPDTDDLLARVIFKNNESDATTQILYVRPQDTIILRWTISIIALDDSNFVDEPTVVNTDEGQIEVSAGTSINDSVAYNGTITIEDENT